MSNKGGLVAVFCGSDYGRNRDAYRSIAISTGRLLANGGYAVATGGGAGMMSDVNESAVNAGCKRVVSIRYGPEDGAHSPHFTEYEIFHNLVDRQHRLISIADAMIVLPGGLGTLYEAAQVLALKRSREIPMEKPVVFVGEEYYRPIKEFIETTIQEGFLSIDRAKLCRFVGSPEAAVAYINSCFTAQA